MVMQLDLAEKFLLLRELPVNPGSDKCNLSALPELMLVLHFRHPLHVRWWLWKVCSLLCYERWQMQSAWIQSSWWIPAAIQFSWGKSICRSFPSHSCSTNYLVPVHLYAWHGLESEIFVKMCQNIAGFQWSTPLNELKCKLQYTL